MKQTFKACGVATAVLAIIASSPLRAETGRDKDEKKSAPSTWRIGTGVSYSRGDYGDPRDTKVVAAPLSLKYAKGPLSFRISVPFVHIDGPGSLIQTPEGRDAGSGSSNSGPGSSNSGSGSSGSGGSGSSGSGSGGSGSGGSNSGGNIAPGPVVPGSLRRSGFGDVNIAMTYSVGLGADMFVDLTGKVKLPTASQAKRLGTGKVDVTAGMDLVKDIGDASLYVGGRRRFAGRPTGSAIRDVWGAGGGTSYRASKSLSIGVDYDWQQSAFQGSGSSSEVTGWASFRIGSAVRMQVYGGTGFTTNSADLVGGVALSWRFK